MQQHRGKRSKDLDKELLRLLRPEEQALVEARAKEKAPARCQAEPLPKHMRVALEQQREGARCSEAWKAQGEQEKRREGDVRLQHALHFASCEAARRIQRAYRRHRLFMQVLHSVRESASALPRWPKCQQPEVGAMLSRSRPPELILTGHRMRCPGPGGTRRAAFPAACPSSGRRRSPPSR